MAHPNTAPITSRDDEVEEAAAGRTVKTLTSVGADEVDGATAERAAVEIYQPLHSRSTGRIVGVLELYLLHAPFHAEALDTQHDLTMALAFGLGLLWLALGAITWSATRRLRRGATAATHAAHHDSLTELPNRLSFSESVADAIEDGEPFVLAVANVDRLGWVNDALGHHNGDELLRHVGFTG